MDRTKAPCSAPSPAPVAFSPAFERALALAASAHRSQLRKGTELPYLTHPVHVAVILLRYGFGEEVVLAGLLHDVVEDCGVSAETVERTCGAEVARLVLAVSERKTENGQAVPWEQRKAEQVESLAQADASVAALKAADAIHNAATITADLDAVGPSVWTRFKRGPGPTVAHQRRLAAVIRERLGAHPITDELDHWVEALAARCQAAPRATR